MPSTSRDVAKLYWSSHGPPSYKCKVLVGRTVVFRNTHPNTSFSPPISEGKDDSPQRLLAGSRHSVHCAREIATPQTVAPNSHAIPSRVPLGRGTLIYYIEGSLTAQIFHGLDNPSDALNRHGTLNEDGEINDRDRYHIPRFLNRLLSLDCDRQNALFAYYANLFDQCVAHAKASGTFDEGVQDIKALSITLAREPELVYIDDTTNAETLHYTLSVETRSTRVTAEEAASLLETSDGRILSPDKREHHSRY